MIYAITSSGNMLLFITHVLQIYVYSSFGQKHNIVMNLFE